MKWSLYVLSGLVVTILTMALMWTQAHSASTYPSQGLNEAPPLVGVFSALYEKPVYNWRVCANLGIGAVPGVSGPRLRFRLCHNQGWQVLTYCLQPARPAPAIGTICSRVSADTYWCGNGIQNLREYRVEETPTPTPSPTSTPVPTGTPLPTPTTTAVAPARTPAPRARPGGSGITSWLAQQALQIGSALLENLDLPWIGGRTPSTVSEMTEDPAHAALRTIYGIDFSDHGKRIEILIQPANRRVNNGKPLRISFLPGKKCRYGDNHACVDIFQSASNGEIVFISAHSGMGGEAEAFRRVVEGSGLIGAAYPPNKISANLDALEGASVVIRQGKKRVAVFTLTAASRLPPRQVNTYLNLPIHEAWAYAATRDEKLGAVFDDQPLIVFETCGWRVRGEPGAARLPITSASIYLGVIQPQDH